MLSISSGFRSPTRLAVVPPTLTDEAPATEAVAATEPHAPAPRKRPARRAPRKASTHEPGPSTAHPDSAVVTPARGGTP